MRTFVKDFLRPEKGIAEDEDIEKLVVDLPYITLQNLDMMLYWMKDKKAQQK